MILYRIEDHDKVAMIDASQGGWDRDRVVFEVIFDMVQCIICRFPVDPG